MQGKLLAAVVGFTVVLTACGGSETPEATPPATPPVTTDANDTTEETAAPEPDGPHGSGCTPSSETSLPDGRWFGFAASTTDTGMAFDLACWFTGEAAVAAAEEDGADAPLNDYYIRNNNELTRELSVADDVVVTYYASGDPQSAQEGDFASWRDVVAERGPLFGIWIETSGGEVTSIAEEWTP